MQTHMHMKKKKIDGFWMGEINSVTGLIVIVDEHDEHRLIHVSMNDNVSHTCEWLLRLN